MLSEEERRLARRACLWIAGQTGSGSPVTVRTQTITYVAEMEKTMRITEAVPPSTVDQ